MTHIRTAGQRTQPGVAPARPAGVWCRTTVWAQRSQKPDNDGPHVASLDVGCSHVSRSGAGAAKGSRLLSVDSMNGTHMASLFHAPRESQPSGGTHEPSNPLPNLSPRIAAVSG